MLPCIQSTGETDGNDHRSIDRVVEESQLNRSLRDEVRLGLAFFFWHEGRVGKGKCAA